MQPNYDKSAASSYRQMAAQALYMFYNFYLVKYHKISNSTIAEAWEKK